MNVTTSNRPSAAPAAGRFAATLLSAFAVAVLCSTAGVARAGTYADEVPSVVVKIDDLNPASQEDTLTLYQRITSAARLVCPDADHRDLNARVIVKACQRSAVDRAVQQLNNPQLAALVKSPPLASLR